MASITQRNSSYRVRIFRKNDKPISKSFASELEATRWLKKTQAELELGLYKDEVKSHMNTQMGFKEAAERYIISHSIHKANYRSETGILRILANRWADERLTTIGKQDIVLLKNDLLTKGRAASTINHYLNALSQLYQIAINEWGLKVMNPITGIKRMSEPQGRIKRLPRDAETFLLDQCYKLNLGYLSDIIAIAIESGMRCGEILSMQWEDVDLVNRRVLLRRTKNGDSRQVPLSFKAVKILEQLQNKKEDNFVFPYSRWSIRRHFTKAIKNAEKAYKGSQNPFIDLRFHDLRHEALSRLSDKGLNTIELAHISGHKTLSMLRRYTHPCHTTLLHKMDEV